LAAPLIRAERLTIAFPPRFLHASGGMAEPDDKRSLRPPAGITAGESNELVLSRGSERRRLKNPTERVQLSAPGFHTTGWTMNVSHRGLTVILERPVVFGVEYEILVGDGAEPRGVRLAWVQEQQGGQVGQVVGLKYLDVDAPLDSLLDRVGDPPKSLEKNAAHSRVSPQNRTDVIWFAAKEMWLATGDALADAQLDALALLAALKGN
jgi:hypothetical protein